MSRTNILRLLAPASLLLGCVTPQNTAQTRAANDFQCPESQVTVTSIGGTSYSASGCGKTGVYDCAASNASNGSVTAYVCRPEQPATATAAPAAAAPAPAPAPATPAPTTPSSQTPAQTAAH